MFILYWVLPFSVELYVWLQGNWYSRTFAWREPILGIFACRSLNEVNLSTGLSVTIFQSVCLSVSHQIVCQMPWVYLERDFLQWRPCQDTFIADNGTIGAWLSNSDTALQRDLGICTSETFRHKSDFAQPQQESRFRQPASFLLQKIPRILSRLSPYYKLWFKPPSLLWF